MFFFFHSEVTIGASLLIQIDGHLCFIEAWLYPAMVCGERTVCVEAGGPDIKLRSEDEMKETAAEKCIFRDKWTKG